MNTVAYFHDFVFPAAFAFLPERMNTSRARALLLAICLQESRLRDRVQIKGPARGFPQFELGTPERPGAIRGVLAHAASRPHLLEALRVLRYPDDPTACYEAVAHNDVLACIFARLLLWTDPNPLPGPAPLEEAAEQAWVYYIRNWRPGKPHRETWNAFFSEAWSYE